MEPGQKGKFELALNSRDNTLHHSLARCSRMGSRREPFVNHLQKVINLHVRNSRDFPTNCEAQSNEQMVGLWKSGQVAMLGLEVYTEHVQPKVLLLNDSTMNMFYLPMHQGTALYELTKLIIKFLAFVKILMPLSGVPFATSPFECPSAVPFAAPFECPSLPPGFQPTKA